MGHPRSETHASVYSQFGEKPDQTRNLYCVEQASLDSRSLWLHKEAVSGEYPCSEVSCWNAILKFHFQIFNTICQVLLYSSLYSLPVISKLERFLADVAVFPSSTLMVGFQCLRHFQARLFPRLFLMRPEGPGV